MNYAAIKKDDIADGPGVRVALYVSGCQLALEGNPCPGCHNFKAWDKNYGLEFTDDTKKEILAALSPDYISGFSLLGGEPLSIFNIHCELDLLRCIKNKYPDKDIWLWTGYIFDKWWNMNKYNNNVKEFISYIDIIIDGPYIEALRNPLLKFRGSSNQRIIRVNKNVGQLEFIIIE